MFNIFQAIFQPKQPLAVSDAEADEYRDACRESLHMVARDGMAAVRKVNGHWVAVSKSDILK